MSIARIQCFLCIFCLAPIDLIDSEDSIKFVEDQIKCFGRIIYEKKFVDESSDFVFYQNSSGANELDCATKCLQKLQFCNSAKYNPSARRCLYSYADKGACFDNDSDKDAESLQLSKTHSSVAIRCIRCVGIAEKVIHPQNLLKLHIYMRAKTLSSPSSLIMATTLATTFSSQRQEKDFGDFVSKENRLSVLLDNATNRIAVKSELSNLDINYSNLEPKSIDKIEDGVTPKPDKRYVAVITDDYLYSDKAKPIAANQGHSTDDSRKYEIISRLKIERPPSHQQQTKHVLPTIEKTNEKNAGKFEIDLPQDFSSKRNLSTFNFDSLNPAVCSDDLLSPCKHDMGRDCVVTTIRNCTICICPLKSPARGCAGPQGLDAAGRSNLLTGRKTCPDGRTPQPVVRYLRKVDKDRKVDNCVLSIQPYCGYATDVSYWRMPRTKSECYYFCYNDSELKSIHQLDAEKLSYFL